MKREKVELTRDELIEKVFKELKSPIYTPKKKEAPAFNKMFDETKYEQFVNEIEHFYKEEKITDAEKHFLIATATRFIEFNYKNIAEYYCHASKDMQELMEKLCLVVIDFDKAIEYGYAKLSEEIKSLYEEGKAKGL